MQPVRIPHHITAPDQIVFWEADELLPAILIFAIGFIVMKKVLISIVAIYVIGKLYNKFKKGRHRGYFKHFLYYYGFGSMTKKMNNGLIRIRVS